MNCADSGPDCVRDPGTALLDRAVDSLRSADQGLKAVWIFPGLGSRFVGMGNDLFGKHPAADELFREAEQVLGFSLESACLEGSGRKHVPARQESQLIYTISCGYAAALNALNFKPTATAGHSLGNWAAGWAAGLYDFKTGLELVTHVEELLEECIPEGMQTMGVVIGLDESVVKSLVAGYPNAWIANWNSPGQYVISGMATEVDGFLSDAGGLQAKRAKRLPTDRALHTELMHQVSERLRDRLKQVRWKEPSVPLVSSADHRVMNTAEDARGFFGTFLERSVCWESSARSIWQQFGSEFVEVGPGNVLSAMFPFIERSITVRTASEQLEQDQAA